MGLFLAAVPGKAWGWGAAILFGGVGALVTGRWGLRNVLLARESRRWPTVLGTVVSAALGANRDSEGTSYRALIRYAYRVDGVAYSGERVCAGSTLLSGSSSGAEKVLARYPAGTAVVVSYDPADPASALLEPGNARDAWILLGMGSVFLCFGIGMAVLVTLHPEKFR